MRPWTTFSVTHFLPARSCFREVPECVGSKLTSRRSEFRFLLSRFSKLLIWGTIPAKPVGLSGATQGREGGQSKSTSKGPLETGSRGKTWQQPGVHWCVHGGARGGGVGGSWYVGARRMWGRGGCGGQMDVGDRGTQQPCSSSQSNQGLILKMTSS